MLDLEQVQKEYKAILQKLSDSELISDREKFEALTKRRKLLEKILEKAEELKVLKNQIEEDKVILKAKEDPELLSLAEEEIARYRERMGVLEKEIEDTFSESEDLKFSSREPEFPGSVIVEIRAGAGGEEAALFATDLFRMYGKYARQKGWKQKTLDFRENDLGGLKSIIFELSNGNVFSEIKYEGGVHRVQRIPKTEKSGRVHTSTATVAVLPRPKKAQIKINPQDLRIDFYRASGPGGQYVNRRETAVRITHLPTGIAVGSQTERNQLQNKENAMAILEAKVLEKKQSEEEAKIGGRRRSQIGGAKRAEKIRTYNFPQDRLTDHRIKKTWKNLEKIMEGNLGSVVSILRDSL